MKKKTNETQTDIPVTPDPEPAGQRGRKPEPLAWLRDGTLTAERFASSEDALAHLRDPDRVEAERLHEATLTLVRIVRSDVRLAVKTVRSVDVGGGL